MAGEGLYFGTSSWKYRGWVGQLYDEARYVYRGRFAETRFNRCCLAEYAQVFHTVGVDAAYYQFPTSHQLVEQAAQVPAGFLFSFKVTDDITLRRFPNLPRFGHRAGTENPDFLNASRFESEFLGPCASIADKVGVLMFEFTRFHASDFARGREFVGALDEFLSRLPRGWRYGVEIRNSTFLQPEYFQTLARHGVAHVFNSWDAMPPVSEQMALPGATETADFVVARLLLRPGRSYAAAVEQFSPYNELKQPYPEVRAAAVALAKTAGEAPRKKKAFVYVNNRLEGSALRTLEAITAEIAPGA
jgi:uncharacterized protein YecE (DUF72 family)